MTRISAPLSLLAALWLFAPAPLGAQALSEQQSIVDQARHIIDDFRADSAQLGFRAQLDDAKGVLIVPSLLRAGFIVGGAAGSGVFLVRDPDGGWSPPAFYTLKSASVGMQIGVVDAQLVLLMMTDKGLHSILKNQIKLGVDATVAMGPLGGRGREASTTTGTQADISSFAKTRGVFGGGTLEGALISSRDDWNAAYYGAKLAPRAILFEDKAANPAAEALRKALGAK